jgi:hypothetical protein
MRRRITVAVLALACMAAGAPMVASGQSTEAKYRALRAEVVKKHGERAPGRNIVRDGVRTKRGSRPARLTEIKQSIEVLRRMLEPPPAPPASSSSNIQQSTSSGLQSGASSSASGLPACADESHGNYSTGPENTNPSSGATGRWQTLRSHYSSGGVCAGLTLSPAGQDACAQRIYKAQGASAWVNCG